MQKFNQELSKWNDLISRLPSPHLLQTWEWAQVKAKYGWEPLPYIWKDDKQIVAAAMVLKRRIPIRGMGAKLNILYAPKGPLMNWSDEKLRERVLNDFQSFAKRQGAIFMKIDPDVKLGTGIPGGEDDDIDKGGQGVMSALKRRDWKFSSDQIQYRNTVWVDLSRSEDEMLSRMKQKTRYNVRLSIRKSVKVRIGTFEDLPMLYEMYAETSMRDGFVIRDKEYYRTVWHTFMDKNMAVPLIATVDGKPIAALMLFWFAERAYYIYGMSRSIHREKMPAYLLQWEAMKKARSNGCQIYDLWGAPDVFHESDGMWGVFRFKRGLGGTVLRTLGAWDYTPRPLLYKLYSELIPRVLGVMRSRGRSRTRQTVS